MLLEIAERSVYWLLRLVIVGLLWLELLDEPLFERGTAILLRDWVELFELELAVGYRDL